MILTPGIYFTFSLLKNLSIIPNETNQKKHTKKQQPMTSIKCTHFLLKLMLSRDLQYSNGIINILRICEDSSNEEICSHSGIEIF